MRTNDRIELTEINQQVSPPLSLPHRQSHYTTQIEVLRTSLLFAEVTNEPSTDLVHLRHDIKKERLDVVKQGLVIQKHFRKKTKVLTIYLGKSNLSVLGVLPYEMNNTPCFFGHLPQK